MNKENNITQIRYQDYPKEPVQLENLSIKFMKQSVFVPVEQKNNTLWIVMADPDDKQISETLQYVYDLDIKLLKGKKEDIFEAIERLYGAGSQSIETIIEEADKDIYEISSGSEADLDHLIDMASEAPIIRLVNRLIFNAVEQNASDIHFEPFENEFQVRYRIDGVLNKAEAPPHRLQAAIISRVKIMSRLDIAERRMPQDGRIKLKIGEKEIDFRVSTIPTLFGESLVMRILDRETLILDLDQLGFPGNIYENYIKLISQPYGMILVTGPTGSGKTSTLYTTLAKINSPENKIITLEDPVEYQLRGINQIQVNPKIGLNFADGLRSIVRQDPDIILVGEIRDKETAEIAVQSALTGHLLFSTLHTNDSPGAITRLLDMGVENFLLSSTLLGILAQRLVRVICSCCKKQVNPDQRLINSMKFDEKEIAETVFYEGHGCEECRNTGFKGRMAIFEFLEIEDSIRKEIIANSDSDSIKRTAAQKGYTTLRYDGWQKVRRGLTTIPEILRVTIEN
ncbi:General secretion pathway protein E [Desulfonema limicola]|uniref:protein-secreting ATPase n=1 Tax=Desulfonema limicola TaxID=45656 RepID=A0A975B793_9BACT|nr:type II secretion system ATPase GspE [Desulfonema limicola]QTA80152.1 General secretion pathway protein E [Desulfonema limicola]